MLIGGALTLFLADLIALRPLRRQLRALRLDVRETERRVVEAMIASQQAEAVNKAFAAYEPLVKSAGSVEAELAAMLSEVEAAARQSGVVPLSLNPIGQGEGPAASTISVKLDGEGNPSQLVGFLDRIQRSTRLLKITELTVRVSEGQTLRASLTISKLLLK